MVFKLFFNIFVISYLYTHKMRQNATKGYYTLGCAFWRILC